jgi:ClpP class serine protease
MSFSTLSAIFKSQWLIDASEARNYLPMVHNMIELGTKFERQDNIIELMIVAEGQQAKTVQSVNGSVISPDEFASKKNTIVMSISGPLLKGDQECGPVGMMTMANMINTLSAQENVGTIILDIDSPGGQVFGTQELANAIKQSPKKTIAVVQEGMACSAAYWIASSCDEIYSTGKLNVFGSIGVMTRIADFDAYYEKEGLKIHNIYSRLSSEKNLDYKEALEGKQDLVKDDLDFVATEFIAAVKANRPNLNLKAGDPFKGATYKAEQALEYGLIDGIKSFKEILQSTMETNNKPNTTSANAADTNIVANAENVQNVETIDTADTAAIETAATENVIEALVKNVTGLKAEDVTAFNAKGLDFVLASKDAAVLSATEKAEYDQLKAWKQESNATHTADADGVDNFKENEATEKDLIAKEMEFVNKKYGI